MENEIPIGTILETKCYYKYFTYTNYNGVNGWIVDIDCYSEKAAKVAEECDIDIITISDAKVYKFPSVESEILMEIPKHTELKVEYEFNYSYDGWSNGFVQVYYNNMLGWINFEDCAVKDYDQPLRADESKFILKATKDILSNDEIVIKSGDVFEVDLKYWITYRGYYVPYDEYGLLWYDIENNVEIVSEEEFINSDNPVEGDMSGENINYDIVESENLEKIEEISAIQNYSFCVMFFVLCGILICLGISIVVNIKR